MLPSLFELLNHLHKRSIQLGKVIQKATRTHRPLSKDLNLSKKTFLFLGRGANCLPKPQEKCQKVSFEKKHGLMLLVKKNHQKTARDLN
jgi:hypothetical protein